MDSNLKQATITASVLVEHFRALVGVPYHHQGRNRFGVDCIGIFILAFEEAGIDLCRLIGVKDTRDYGPHLNPRAQQMLNAICGAVIPKPVHGCLISLTYGTDRGPRHYAVYADPGTMIHADGRAGMRRVVEHRLIKPKRLNFWKLPGVDYDA